MKANGGHQARTRPGLSLGSGSRMFEALAYPKFRRYWSSNLAAVSGQQMMWLAQGWLIYDLTDSAVYLGYVGLATAGPAILLNLVGGVVADRLDQRRVIFSTQVITAASVLILATLTALDLVRVWHLLAVAFVSGSMQAFNNPARQAILRQLVDRKDLTKAVQLNSIVWQATRIVAPAAGGLIYGFAGPAATFYLCGAAFFVLGAVVAGIDIEQPLRERRDSVFGDLNEGISFIRTNFVFAFLIGMSFFNSFFGFSSQQLLPVFARDILEVGPEGLGVLFSASGVGSMFGVFALGYFGEAERKGALVIGGATAFGSFIVLFALSTFYPLSLAAIFCMGAAGTIYMITVQVVLQVRVPDALRGRVMGIYGITHNIGPLGSLQAGFLADEFGAPAAMVVGGAAIIAFAVGVAASRREVRALQAAPSPA